MTAVSHGGAARLSGLKSLGRDRSGRGAGGSTSFGSTLGGHVAVMVLLQRCRLLASRLEPHTVDEGWNDSYGPMWSSLAVSTLGHDPGIQAATRANLFAMAKAALETIESLPARADWYPEGWQAIAAIIRGGGEQPIEEARPAQRQSPRGDPRSGALDAVNYVACELGVSEDEVLRRMRRRRGKLNDGDVMIAMALLPDVGSR